ncbi:MAG: hypothetical protein ACREO1_14795 [Arenimonas sp.]
MHLLNTGRPAFLEFLRNLTPQTMLISLCLVLWHGLDFSEFDENNWQNTSAFFVIAFISILAFLANTLQFMENASCSFGWLDKAASKNKRIAKTSCGRMFALLRIVFKRKPLIFAELTLAALVLNAGVIVATNMAIASAITIIKATSV